MASLFIDGASGIGGELGLEGLDEHREAKHILENTAPSPTGRFGGAA